ncbi:MAG: HAMP domain-containing histidine kinase [Symploca sp. SIO3C6]|uniref:histidine kinase n=1 Tax=Symploca sp. SIO1C4 TaxID=2607765 RepID=A0A6B3NBE1_9CYAN|nr:HAMP domain-containing histidine kinase [Symploca sp. SIO3C6]NER30439.1 HAMP domain-containing histidine kinase [Symploca sp. SIO1C4]NET07428.1 HAMP domain-containing histidine kinase [Symploca sp. SIO2B6]
MKVVSKSSLSQQDLSTNKTKTRGFFWEARTRILVWYGVMMTSFIGLCVPIFSELVLYHVDRRVREELVQELEAFEKFAREQSSTSEQLTTQELQDIFRRFLYRQIPEDDTFLITLSNGKFYRSSPRARPKLLQENSALMKQWGNITHKLEGEQETGDPNLGNIIYLAVPINLNGKVQGTFAIAHITAGEIKEARQVIWIVIKVLLTGLVLALILAWIASGKVLAPLRSLSATARSISESNFNHRIPVQGKGELGELATTFNRMLDRLQESFTSQKAFINDAGHELRTPITIIRGHLELMGDDPQEKRETVELAIDELDRMSRMVDDLILLTKSERPDFLQLEKIDLFCFTQELYTKATGLAHRHWQLDAQAIGVILGDRQRLTQAVMNLTDNASQYTTETDTIAIGSAIDYQWVRLWVRDTGMGIAEIDQQKIFERFARASNSRRRSEGSGLGLSIVRAIAQAHGGRVELTSTLGMGSTFTLILPLDPSQAK